MITELTIEKLKAERADLYNSIFGAGEAEGKKSGEKFERERVVAVLKKAKTFKDMDALALEAVENGASLETATIKFQDKQLAGLQPKGGEPGKVIEGEMVREQFKKLLAVDTFRLGLSISAV